MLLLCGVSIYGITVDESGNNHWVPIVMHHVINTSATFTKYWIDYMREFDFILVRALSSDKHPCYLVFDNVNCLKVCESIEHFELTDVNDCGDSQIDQRDDTRHHTTEDWEIYQKRQRKLGIRNRHHTQPRGNSKIKIEKHTVTATPAFATDNFSKTVPLVSHGIMYHYIDANYRQAHGNVPRCNQMWIFSSKCITGSTYLTINNFSIGSSTGGVICRDAICARRMLCDDLVFSTKTHLSPCSQTQYYSKADLVTCNSQMANVNHCVRIGVETSFLARRMKKFFNRRLNMTPEQNIKLILQHMQCMYARVVESDDVGGAPISKMCFYCYDTKHKTLDELFEHLWLHIVRLERLTENYNIANIDKSMFGLKIQSKMSNMS